jgi:hypothetical protein
MSKETRITTDGATVKTKGQDLIVSPKRLTMFLVTILLGGFGGLLVLGFLAGLVKSATEGEWGDIIEFIPLIIVAGGLIGVAYFAFNKGKNQQDVHFDATNRHVKVGKEIVSFDSITGVYLYHMGNMTLGDISGVIIQTGIVSDKKTIPITSVSKPKQEDNMADAVMLIRLYAEHLGHDPNVLGKYEALVTVDLYPKLPVTFPFESNK